MRGDNFRNMDFSGKNNPMYGRKRPDVVERNLKNNPMKDPLVRKKQSIFMTNNNPMKDPLVRKKLSIIFSGKGNPMYGRKRHHSEETKKKMRKWWNEHPDQKEKVGLRSKKINAGCNHPMYGKKRPDTSEMMKKGFSAYMQSKNTNPSKPQVALYKHIKKIYPTAKLNFSIRIRKDKYFSLDVAVPNLKIDYEYDGVYWHKDREVEDFFRDEALTEKGWVVVRIKEGEKFE